MIFLNSADPSQAEFHEYLYLIWLLFLQRRCYEICDKSVENNEEDCESKGIWISIEHILFRSRQYYRFFQEGKIQDPNII